MVYKLKDGCSFQFYNNIEECENIADSSQKIKIISNICWVSWRWRIYSRNR